jgi:ribonuclease J
MSNKSLKIIPLGGLGEVGKNMTVLEYGNNILIIDTGIMFPENDMLGIDYIIPDFQYVLDRREIVRGIVNTHGHEDHIGAIGHVYEEINAPIYATPLTMGLLEGKLKRSGLHKKAQLNIVNAGDQVNIGPFTVHFCHVSHSIPDGVALGIDTPAGFIVHSGDYKFDHTPVDNWPTDYTKLSEFAGRGVLALLADSTNADEPGWTLSERVIDPAFEETFRQARGRVIVASFASLISRMEQVGKAAAKNGRKLAFVGTSMRENYKIAKKLGYLHLPDDLVIPLDDALSMEPHKVALMCTGSQGEPSSILGRLATGRNRQFDLLEGDTIVLSSHPIPGNEETVSRTINRLFQRGANVIYDPIASVHVSGHASQEEMKLLIHLIKPKYLIPIHGELRHLRQHAILAQEVGVPEENIAVVENGHVIEFEDGEMRIGERIPGGYVFVEGIRVGDVGPSVLREREALSQAGIIFVNLLVNHKNGTLVKPPEIITRGFLYHRETNGFLEAIGKEAEKIAKQSNADRNLSKEVEKGIKSFIYKETKTRPMIFAVVNEV